MVILVIDDDKEDFDIFRDAVSVIDPTIECLYAADGQHALHLLSTVLPDYIFLDVNMPVMDGRECLKHLKSDPRLQDIPVIMLSTSRNSDEITALEKLGIKHYLTKPPSFQELVKILKNELESLDK